MKRLLLPFLAELALPTAVNGDTLYLNYSSIFVQKINKGFLLIELVIVIAVLAIL